MESEYYLLCEKTIAPYINGDIETCSYCDKLAPLILLEGEHTYITIAIGQFVEGYLQVCSKEHRTAATGMLFEERKEFELMKECVRNTFFEFYGVKGIAFEHGQAGSCMFKDSLKNSLCHHAHTHMVPVQVDIREKIKEFLPNEIPLTGIESLVKIRKEVLLGGGYLYFENHEGKGFAYEAEGIDFPRQFLRTCVASSLGIPEKADWVEFSGLENFENTKLNLQSILESQYSQLIHEGR